MLVVFGLSSLCRQGGAANFLWEASVGYACLVQSSFRLCTSLLLLFWGVHVTHLYMNVAANVTACTRSLVACARLVAYMPPHLHTAIVKQSARIRCKAYSGLHCLDR